jgi:hypothetical protein
VSQSVSDRRAVREDSVSGTLPIFEIASDLFVPIAVSLKRLKSSQGDVHRRNKCRVMRCWSVRWGARHCVCVHSFTSFSLTHSLTHLL